MSSQVAAERRQILIHRNGAGVKRKTPPVVIPCISRTLYETPPQSNFFPLQFFYNMLHLLVTILSKFVPGQFAITVFDYYMVKLEKILDFCIPQEMSAAVIAEKNRKTLALASRPLTWIFFIPALIALRVIRFYLSAGSILIGRGEVTARQMQMKIVGFRRYYRSIRHYAVKRYTPIQLMLRASRCDRSFTWRLIYHIYELFVMTKPPVEHHSNMPDEGESSEDQTDKNYRNGNSSSVKKNSLNDIDTDDSSDDDLDTNEMLEEYGKAQDTSADPDYVPNSGDESSDESSSSTELEIDTEEEKTESQQQLNGEPMHSQANDPLNDTSYFSDDLPETPRTPVRDTLNGYASDQDTREKSKIDQQQLKDLENQLVMKIMKHFKETFNYPPPNGPGEDVFYSPIGSPPEKGYHSDPEMSPITNHQNRSENENPIQQISSSEENSEKSSKETQRAQVSSPPS